MDAAGATVAVVIPSWNSAELLPRCLESLARARRYPLELMVVDNGSVDGSVEYLRERGHPPPNPAAQRRLRRGDRTSASPAPRRPTILALNADTVLEPGCVAALAAALDGGPGLGGVQPRILQLEGEAPRGRRRPASTAPGRALTRDGRAVEIGAGERAGAGAARAGARSSASAAPPACCGGSSSPSSAATTRATSPSTRTST